MKLAKYNVLFAITVFAVANSIPLYLATFALPTILRIKGANLTTIGLIGGLMLPWALKFTWAPLLDRYFMVWVGKRKSWLIPTQFTIILSLIILSIKVPEQAGLFTIVIILVMLISAATHYLATSAFIFEQLNPKILRYGNYAQVIGTACGSFAGGGLFLIGYDQWGWQSMLTGLVFLNLIILILTMLASEKPYLPVTDHIGDFKPNPSIFDFFRRKNTRTLLYLCLSYRGCEGLVMGMQQPFLVDNHISLNTIGKVIAISGLTTNLLAAGVIAKLLAKGKDCNWLFFCGILRTLAYFSLAVIALSSNLSPVFLLAIVVVNMSTRAMEMVVLYTVFMRYSNASQPATDIAILLCAEIIIYSSGVMASGYLAHALGYISLFTSGAVLSLITTLVSYYLLSRLGKLSLGLS